MTAHAEARFDPADQNSNGTFSAQEMIAQHAKAPKRLINKMIKKMDANDDGQVSFKEMQNGHKKRKLAKMFNRLENNEDCFICAQKFEEMKDNRSSKWFRFFA